MIDKPILDACCGGRMFWFNKKHPKALFCDVRRESFVACDGRKIDVNPDIQADFRKMPFDDASFHLVVFDPPHLDNAGKKGWMAQKYGILEKTWRADLKAGFDECMRVLKPHGTLIFKWNEERILVSDLLNVLKVEPLIGHRTRQSSKTIWMAFMKFSEESCSLDPIS